MQLLPTLPDIFDPYNAKPDAVLCSCAPERTLITDLRESEAETTEAEAVLLLILRHMA